MCAKLCSQGGDQPPPLQVHRCTVYGVQSTSTQCTVQCTGDQPPPLQVHRCTVYSVHAQFSVQCTSEVYILHVQVHSVWYSTHVDVRCRCTVYTVLYSTQMHSVHLLYSTQMHSVQCTVTRTHNMDDKLGTELTLFWGC